MKKKSGKTIFLPLFCILLLLGLFGCQTNPDGTEETKTERDSPKSLSQVAIHQSYTYGYEVVYSTEHPSEVESVSVINKGTNEVLQTITPEESEGYTKMPAYFLDVTFDGQADLLIPLTRSAYSARCAAFAWDEETGKFHEIEGFNALSNFSVDFEKEQILSHFSGDQSVSYSIFEYDSETNELVKTHSLFWSPAEVDGKTSFTEEDKDSVIKSLELKEGSDIYSLDETDPQISSYFSEGSLWDLKSRKWISVLSDEFK